MKRITLSPGLTALPSRPRLALGLGLLLLVGAGAPRLSRENLLSDGGELSVARALPEFPESASDWVGTPPLTVADLRGRVWVLKVWTFGCVNCVRSIPYANQLVERYGDRVGVLGVHSPEFDWERDLEQLEATLREHGVRFPSYIDGSLDYFFALEAPGWPAFYVVDRRARMRGLWVGEVHPGTLRARALERLIEELLAEPNGQGSGSGAAPQPAGGPFPAKPVQPRPPASPGK